MSVKENILVAGQKDVGFVRRGVGEDVVADRVDLHFVEEDRARYANPSVAGIVEHPGYAEFVTEFAVGGAPETLMQGSFDLAAGGEAIKKGIDLPVAVAVEAEVHRVAGLEAVADHVGAHEEDCTVFGEGAVEDQGALFGGHFCGEGGFGDLLEFEVAFEALLVKSERFAALAIEIQIGIQV